MNPFYVNDKLKSYAYPIIKILICIALILVMINREHFLHFDNKMINIAETILCTTIVVACIFCIYISGAEMIYVYENRAKETVLSGRAIAECKEFTIDEIVSMAEHDDIIDLQIVWKNKAIGIGASANSKNFASALFDKRYYINREEYESIGEFRAALSPYATNGKVSVITIDGAKPK